MQPALPLGIGQRGSLSLPAIPKAWACVSSPTEGLGRNQTFNCPENLVMAISKQVIICRQTLHPAVCGLLIISSRNVLGMSWAISQTFKSYAVGPHREHMPYAPEESWKARGKSQEFGGVLPVPPSPTDTKQTLWFIIPCSAELSWTSLTFTISNVNTGPSSRCFHLCVWGIEESEFRYKPDMLAFLSLSFSLTLSSWT